MEDIAEKEKLAYIHEERKNKSAKYVVTILKKHLDFKNVLDLGCGLGRYSKWFKRKGFEVYAVDGNPDANPPHLADFRKPQKFGKFDLVFCIEVAEHIEKKYADIFADTLTNNCNRWIILTTCPPTRNIVKSDYDLAAHVNEQPKEYWIDKICRRGFRYLPEETEKFQKLFNRHPDMPNWFYNDLMIFECAD